MCFVAAELEREGFATPLLIGGATTSRVHTAVKINPNYQRGQAVYVTRRQPRGGRRAGADVDKRARRLHGADARRIRKASPTRMRARKLDKQRISLAAARANAMKIDWAAYEPPKPTFIGARVFATYDVAELVPYIDWTPFFQTWELKGRYPALLRDEERGPAARQLFEDAQAMLEAHRRGALVHSQGGHRLLARQRGRRRHRALHRRIARRTARDAAHAAPAACASRRQAQYRARRFRRAGVFRQSRLHRRLRRHIGRARKKRSPIASRAPTTIMGRSWSRRSRIASPKPSPSACTSACAANSGPMRADEDFAPEELLGEDYRGIRPAPGYPAQPDHTEKATLFDLLRRGEAHRRAADGKLRHDAGLVGQRTLYRAMRARIISASPRSSATRSRITPPARACRFSRSSAGSRRS